MAWVSHKAVFHHLKNKIEQYFLKLRTKAHDTHEMSFNLAQL
jgi:hypothetical protein